VTSRPVAEQRLRDLAWLRRVRDRIDREYAQPLDVEALARSAHMSVGLGTVGVAILIAGIACSDRSSGTRRYPSDVVANFTRSCVATGSTADGCACMLRYFEDRYTLEEFAAIEAELATTSSFPPEVIDAIAACN
jgi:hypothetical protein